MSYTPTTYPTLWRDPQRLDSAYVAKVIAAVQDSSSWAEMRDVLLRYYVPFSRGSINPPVEVFHSPTKNPSKNFIGLVYSGRSVSLFPTESFDSLVKASRADSSLSPYERVGRVYAMLRTWKKENPHLSWSHRLLKRWMHQLLIDYTLYDLRKEKTSVLSNVFDVVQDVKKLVEPDYPLDWTNLITKQEKNISGHKYYFKISDANKYLSHRRLVEANVYSNIPVAALLLSPYYGVASESNIYNRDLGNHMINYALLSHDGSPFEDTKNMWIDYLSYGGKKWTNRKTEILWNVIKEKAYNDYKLLLSELLKSNSAYTLSSIEFAKENPTYFVYRDINWAEILSTLVERYPLLNQDAQFEKYIKTFLSVEAYEEYKKSTKEKLGVNILGLFYNISMNDIKGLDFENKTNVFKNYILLNDMLNKTSTTVVPLPDDVLGGYHF